MTLLRLKNQLKKKLEKSKDPEIIRTALLVLAEEVDHGERNLKARVSKAEKDYVDGRTMTIDEARLKSKRTIGQLYAAKRQRAKRA